ncbi:MAG TPA: glycosyltransferase family 2 protein [Armatimonadota bacterium]|nr:glycosyltransferase family 2 protein [Armatimonadota bacterium]
MQKVIVVMPAYNAAATLLETYRQIPKDIVSEVLLVDDASRDETVAVARKLNIPTLVHPENRGYGANQKTCYTEALRRGAEIVVMLHPDYQYDPRLIADMIQAIRKGQADLVLGSRLLGVDGRMYGMPAYKYFSNRFLTSVENRVMGTRLSELHTGYRAYSRRLLTTIPYLRNSDDFVFDSQVLFQAVAFGFKIAEISVPCRYMPEASSINFIRSLKYGFSTLGVAAQYALHKRGWIKCPLFRRDFASLVALEEAGPLRDADEANSKPATKAT